MVKSTGNQRHRCDRCGTAASARKRTCPYTVLGDSLNGARVELPYCAAPRLCDHCYAEMGGRDGVHGQRCRDGAAENQARDDETERLLDAGESLSVDAWGDWDPRVPAGMVGIKFVGRAGDTYRLMPWTEYRNKLVAVSAVASHPWQTHP